MPKILAIDDSKTMRLAIKITFQAEEGEVVTVSKGSEAVARAKKQGSDIVLVDAVLADGEPSGYDVCRALKADPETASIPVMIMVSNQTGIDNAAVEACGADGAITKPFDTTDLINKVNAAVAAGAKPGAKPTAAPTISAPKAQAPKSSPAPAPAPAPVAAAPKLTPAAVASPKPAKAGPRITPSPVSSPRPSSIIPAPVSAAKPAAAASGNIPIVMPIPFTPTHAPTAGILKRLSEGGSVEGIDPKAVSALLSLSREVIEQVVWEVVPDLAEQIIRERQAN
ncbi:MAG: response regulator [Myxococcales bacterium]|nr:response regulator [Myxococcales bacterium]